MMSVGVGWVEGNEDHLAELLRTEVLNVASGLRGVPCAMLRSDKTAPTISKADFRPPGSEVEALADTVDLLVLAGHGSAGEGLPLNADDTVKSNTVVFGGRLRVAVMVSCTILEGTPGGMITDPMAWRAVFGGLHRLIAPKSFVSPSPGRGERFAKYLSEGESFVDAWKFACAESGEPVSKWRSLAPKEVTETSALNEEALHGPQPLSASLSGLFTLQDLA